MLITIQEFRACIERDPAGLIVDLQALTGRYGQEEADAWRSSLGKLSEALRSPAFQPLHLYFGSRGHLALEYQLPASASWCDVVMLGAHRSKMSAVILELKHWMTRADRPGRYEGLIERQGIQELHPSDQVRGYTEYCRQFHSAVADYDADVHGCALLTRDRWTGAYYQAPNDRLVGQYPLFCVSEEDVDRRFPKFFESRLTEPDEEFARAFAGGKYRQDRGFVAQIGAQILDPKSRAFELLDNQRRAFALCRSTVDDTLGTSSAEVPRKRVVVIKGPPGSGKSVIAARLWASLVTDSRLPEGDVIFVTTSLSQNSNWSDLFGRTAGVGGAFGVVRKATAYSPLTNPRYGQLNVEHGLALFDPDNWRENLRRLRVHGERFRDGTNDEDNLVSIVDEAHALINPERQGGKGPFGFPPALGPQAYHIMRASVISIFLLDPLQGFRQRENTSIDDIRDWARELGVDEIDEISLEGAQFRCAGSTDFVTWVEGLLAGKSVDSLKVLARNWQGSGDTRSSRPMDMVADNVASSRAWRTTPTRPCMEAQLFHEPEAWEELLRVRYAEGASVRILSTYSRPWKTKHAADPHACRPEMMDFHEPYRANSNRRFWSRVWNVVGPRDDYTWYVTGHPAGRIAVDPLCEVGCPYAVRGFDYDYVGIVWLDDLVWRDGSWEVDPLKVEESGILGLTRAARRERRCGIVGQNTVALLERVCQAYRILFTRALRGVYLWVPDDATRAHLVEAMGR
jgi:hypothetical protein